MKCSKCGNEIANDSLFCEYCGTQIIKDNVKKVDVRWCLLPAMLITTYAMLCPLEMCGRSLYLGWNSLLIIIPISLFTYTLYLAYKKKTPKSFVLMMFALLIANSAIEYKQLSLNMDIDSTIHSDCEHSEHMGLRNRFFNNYSNIMGCFNSCVDELNEVGESNIGLDDYDELGFYAYSWYAIIIEAFVFCILLPIYLVYAIIARKKGWKF